MAPLNRGIFYLAAEWASGTSRSMRSRPLDYPSPPGRLAPISHRRSVCRHRAPRSRCPPTGSGRRIVASLLSEVSDLTTAPRGTSSDMTRGADRRTSSAKAAGRRPGGWLPVECLRLHGDRRQQRRNATTDADTDSASQGGSMATPAWHGSRLRLLLRLLGLRPRLPCSIWSRHRSLTCRGLTTGPRRSSAPISKSCSSLLRSFRGGSAGAPSTGTKKGDLTVCSFYVLRGLAYRP